MDLEKVEQVRRNIKYKYFLCHGFEFLHYLIAPFPPSPFPPSPPPPLPPIQQTGDENTQIYLDLTPNSRY